MDSPTVKMASNAPLLRHCFPLSFPHAVSRSIFIKVESTPNPDSMKFLPENFVVLPEKFGNGVVRQGRRGGAAAAT